MGKVITVGGVFLKSENPARLYAWYEKHLSLKRDPGREGLVFHWADAAASGRHGFTVISFFPSDTAYFGPGAQTCMVNLCVDDLDGLVAFLQRDGVAIDGRENYDYGRFAWITDPEGNRVELWEPPKDSARKTEGRRQ